MVNHLSNIRKRLDQIDRRIIDALADRQDVIREVAQLKASDGTQLRDIMREEDLLTRLVALGHHRGLDTYYITRLFREILEHSVRYQQDFLADQQNPNRKAQNTITVAYQGAEGAYSYIAAMKHFGPRDIQVIYRGEMSFSSMLQSVKDGLAHYAMLPIENTTAGSINEAYDLLAGMNLSIVGEEVLLIEHCLVAIKGATLENLKRIYSHPQALAQCSNFLSRLSHCIVESYLDTAMAVKNVKLENDLTQAAIASEEAAELYKLSVLNRNIANQKDNYTRFVVVAKEGAQYDERVSCKTSLIFATKHEEGALLKCLNVLASYDLNLTKLESRPRPNIPWEYLFYLDFEGNISNPDVKDALKELSSNTSFLRVLGSYPARTTRDMAPAQPRRSVTEKEQKKSPEKPTGRSKHVSQQLLEHKPYKLVTRLQRPEDSTIVLGNLEIGAGRPIVIAGPSLVESYDQITQCARAAKNSGADILYGGCFRAHSGPDDFPGLGLDGLEFLEQAGHLMDLPITTEVIYPNDVNIVAQHVDILQIGGRNMQNFALLKEVGQIDRPVVIRRGVMASIDEWLKAAEIVLETGNQQVILCERGIRTFETATRNTLDLSAILVTKEISHLPIIVDPSFASGSFRWVAPLVEAALISGAHGIMLDIHPDPDKALTDGEQALTFHNFDRLMQKLADHLE